MERINTLVEQFTNHSLPKGKWTHEAHIIVAFWHNWNYDFEKAIELVKNKIISYNETVGTKNSDSSGYHETLTMFWMILTKNYLIEHNFQTLEKACNQFINSKLTFVNLPLDYYSKTLLFSKKARQEWVNGDLKSIILVD